MANSKVTLKHGDFRELIRTLPADSIDLILTDPPYAKAYLPLWKDLSIQASRVLKPSGFLIAYSGHSSLPEKMCMLSEHLTYYSLGTLYHKGRIARRFEVRMFNRGKPILFYQKPPRKKQDVWLEDVLISEKPNKIYHKWGQSIEPFIKLIECFTNPDDTVLEPFAGGGSIIEACIQTERKVIGYEIEKESYNKVKSRFGIKNYGN